MRRLSNPGTFLAFADRVLPYLVALSVAMTGIMLWQAFFVAPPDYQQGETVRIMFIHVPAAALGMGCWLLMAASALGTLVWKHPMADVAAQAAEPLGAAFTFICLVTGALWGRPMWGTYWVWDARLTSVLILFLLYLAMLALRASVEDHGKAARLCAVFALVGAINIPIIRFSVNWWNTLHQPASLIRLDGPAIHSSILTPLLLCLAAWITLFLTLHLAAMRNLILRRRLLALEQQAAYTA